MVESGGDKKNHRILVVEDDEDLRLFMAGTLRTAGYDVVEAADGTLALEHLRRGWFAGIVLDMLLPGKSGVEILKERLSWSAPNRPRVVAVSGGGPEIAGAHAINLARLYSSDAVLYKPFTPDELIAAVRAVV